LEFLNPDKAATGGKTNKAIKVRTVKFSSILQKYGVPYYCKIDIEGNDRICLQGIDPQDKPAYLSIEMSHTIGDRDIASLQELGYRRFKILSQANFAPANAQIDRVARSLPRQMTWRMRRLEGKLFGKFREGQWDFKMGRGHLETIYQAVGGHLTKR
jgi:Methyltransferase FkbM domain